MLDGYLDYAPLTVSVSARRVERLRLFMCLIAVSLNHVVALLGFVLAISSYMVLKKYGVPDKICVGAGVLSALVVAMFWSSVMLGADDDDDDD